MKILQATLLSSLLAGSIACGGDLNKPGGGGGSAGTTGTGGTVGTGGGSAGTTGAGGTVGTGGTTGTGIPIPPPPRCLADLVASCPLTSSCQFQFSDGGSIDKYCYATGETRTPRSTGSCNNNLGSGEVMSVEEVRRADGTLCYSVERQCSCSQACEISHTTWKNAAGTVVARGVLSRTISVTCEGTGETCQGEITLAASADRQSCLPPPAYPTCTEGICL